MFYIHSWASCAMRVQVHVSMRGHTPIHLYVATRGHVCCFSAPLSFIPLRQNPYCTWSSVIGLSGSSASSWDLPASASQLWG